ncbi:MAG: DEAD/DEAH box helicase [Desulfobacteraceae bacterium]|nr:DEAD/DEAH box helicase [Desulfobacteraceae bacterium]
MLPTSLAQFSNIDYTCPHMKTKRFYRGTKSRSKPKNMPPMKPGADKGLIRIFEKIGVPDDKPFVPDPFQIEAIEAIQETDCLVTAPTGAGKTWIAEEVTRKSLEKAGRIWYATPLKALTNSIHNRFSQLFGPENVGILTGDIKENADAPVIIGTTEILRNQLYDAMHTGESLNCDLIILDEAHYLGDTERVVPRIFSSLRHPVSVVEKYKRPHAQAP